MSTIRKNSGVLLAGAAALSLAACGGGVDVDQSDPQEVYDAWGEAIHENDGETVCHLSMVHEDGTRADDHTIRQGTEPIPVSEDSDMFDACVEWVEGSLPDDQADLYDPEDPGEFSGDNDNENLAYIHRSTGGPTMYRMDDEWYVAAGRGLEDAMRDAADG